jgi:hypothetical protein
MIAMLRNFLRGGVSVMVQCGIETIIVADHPPCREKIVAKSGI